MEVEFSSDQEDDRLDGCQADESARAALCGLEQAVDGLQKAVGLTAASSSVPRSVGSAPCSYFDNLGPVPVPVPAPRVRPLYLGALRWILGVCLPPALRVVVHRKLSATLCLAREIF